MKNKRVHDKNPIIATPYKRAEGEAHRVINIEDLRSFLTSQNPRRMLRIKIRLSTLNSPFSIISLSLQKKNCLRKAKIKNV
jgi:hypothetical protein